MQRKQKSNANYAQRFKNVQKIVLFLQVLRGGDRAIDVVVIDPDIKVTEHDASKTEGHITFKATKEGKLYTL